MERLTRLRRAPQQCQRRLPSAAQTAEICHALNWRCRISRLVWLSSTIKAR